MFLEIIFSLIAAYVWGSFGEWVLHRYTQHREFKGVLWAFYEHKKHHAIYRPGHFQASPVGSPARFANLDTCLEVNLIMTGLPALVLLPFHPIASVALFAIGLLHFYIYQMHTAMHLRHQPARFVPRWFFRLCQWNHFMHHQHPDKFFCVALPGFDWLAGTVCKTTDEDRWTWKRNIRQETVPIETQRADEYIIYRQNGCKFPKWERRLSDICQVGMWNQRPDLETYSIGQNFCRVMQFLFIGDIEMTGARNINWDDMNLFILNHGSWKDVFLIHLLFPRPIRLMTAESVLRWGYGLGAYVLGYLLGGISTAPGQSQGAVRMGAQALANSYGAVAICPEGWAYLDGKVRPFKKGFLRIADMVNQRSFDVGSNERVRIWPINITYGRYPGPWINSFPPWAQYLITAGMPWLRSGAAVHIHPSGYYNHIESYEAFYRA